MCTAVEEREGERKGEGEGEGEGEVSLQRGTNFLLGNSTTKIT